MWLLSGDNNREADVNPCWSKGRAAFLPAPCCSAVAGFWFPRNPEVPNAALSFWIFLGLGEGKENKGLEELVLGLAPTARLKEPKPSPEHPLLPGKG